MKKRKIFLTLILSLIMCVSVLTGCSGNDGYYIENSFEADISYYTSMHEVGTMVKFKVACPETGRYEVRYTLSLFHDGELVQSKAFTSDIRSDSVGIAEVSEYWSGVPFSGTAYEWEFSVELSNVFVESKFSGGTAYVGIAIGFGVTGGLILAGIIALYIYLNKKDGKEQAA